MTDYRETTGKRSNEEQTSGLWDDATDLANDVKEDAEDQIDDTTDTVTDAGSDAIDYGTDAGSSFGEGAMDSSDALDGVGDTVDGALDGAEETFDDAADTVQDTKDDVTEGDFSDFGGALGDGVDNAVETFSGAGEDLSSSVDDLTGDIGSIGDEVGNIAGGMESSIDGFTSTLDDAGGNLGDTFGDIANDAGGALGDGFDSVTDIGSNTFDSVTDFGSNTLGSIGESAGDLWDAGAGIGGGALDWGGDAVNFGSDVLDSTIDGTVDLGEGAADLVTGNGGGGSGDEQWGELQKVEQMGRCVIQKQESNQGNTRFMTISANSDGDEVFVASDGTFTPVSSVEGFNGVPFHDSVAEARSACEAADMDVSWGEISKEEEHAGGVVMRQSSDSDAVRFFAFGPGSDGGTVAYAADGSSVTVGDNTSPDELPSYPKIEAARSALSDNTDTSRQWGEIEQVNTVGQCAIMGQQSSDGNSRFFTFTRGENGELVAVSNEGDGVVVSSVENAQQLPHYPTAEDAAAACPSTEEQPDAGGDKTTTDDSTSSDGPTSDNTQPETTEVSSNPEAAPPSQSEVQSNTSSLGGGQSGGGIMSQTVAGIPLPLAAVGGLGAAGLVLTSFGGDDEPEVSRRSTPRSNNRGAAQGRSNVTRRGSTGANGMSRNSRSNNRGGR